MSIEAMVWAINAPLGGSSKLVLIGLANHAHADGSHAFPTVEKLAKYAHVDRRTVQRALRQLEVEGYIAPHGKGANGQTNYTLRMGRHDAARVTDAAPRGDTGVLEGAAPAPPEPSDNRKGTESSLRELRARPCARLDELIAPVDEAAANDTGGFGGRWTFGDRDRVYDFLAGEPEAVQAEVCGWLERQARMGWSRGSIASAVAGSVVRIARENAARQPSPHLFGDRPLSPSQQRAAWGAAYAARASEPEDADYVVEAEVIE